MTDVDSALGALGRIGVIGAGAVGSTLARVLAARGARVVRIASRAGVSAAALAKAIPGAVAAASPAEVVAAADLVVLAVPDDAIAPLAESLPWRAGQAALHLSGATPAAALAPAAVMGARIAALHPLMTFPRLPLDTPIAALIKRLDGCVWALDCADPALAASLEALVAALGGRAIRIGEADRVPYHISGVLASNYVAVLLGAATELWAGFGVAPDEALRALLPLLRATVEHLERVGLPQALTGPLARGDSGTVAAHLDWLDAHAAADARIAALRAAYVALGRLALPIARARGTLTPDAVAHLATLLGADADTDDTREGPASRGNS
jgi:predicted short-subunit dehydrogenase-like oxidoreductase (DUF2520 family)